jgi:cell division protein FtsW (lipid II flippase)
MAAMAKSRILLLAAFLCPLLAGLVFMALAGAPTAYLITNAAAAFFVATTYWRAPQIKLQSSLLVVTIIVPVFLVGTFAGPAVEDVHRWIALGPIKLHAAMLVLPLFATQMYRQDKRIIAVAVTVLAIVVALQPDCASASALFLASFCWYCFVQGRWQLATLFISGAALVSTMLTADTLPPVRFVEDVIGEAALFHSGIAALLVATILVAIAGPPYVVWRSRIGQKAPFTAWSACLAGYFLASLVGPYPVPLLGYGVSSILGFGLALALLDQERGAAV